MPRYGDLDKMAEDNYEAYMNTLPHVYGETRKINAIVHMKIDKIIEDTPTVDAVPVVRCKECWKRGQESLCPMYFVEEQYYDDDGWTEVSYDLYDNTTDDGFCDQGERRNDG